MTVKLLKTLVCGLLIAFTVGACTQESDSGTLGGEALKALLKDSTKPAVIKFYADWCVTCKEYAPDFEKVENELANDVDFFAVNIDEPSSKALVKEFKIAHIPVTVFASKDRTAVSKQFAPISYENLKKKVLELVNQ